MFVHPVADEFQLFPKSVCPLLPQKLLHALVTQVSHATSIRVELAFSQEFVVIVRHVVVADGHFIFPDGFAASSAFWQFSSCHCTFGN